MNASEWLDAVAAIVVARAPQTEVLRSEPGMLTFARGVRGVFLKETGGVIVLSPSLAAGTTIASRLEEKVRHFDVQPFALAAETSEPAAEAVLAHLSN